MRPMLVAGEHAQEHALHVARRIHVPIPLPRHALLLGAPPQAAEVGGPIPAYAGPALPLPQHVDLPLACLID